METVIKSNTGSIFDIDESELLAKLERAQKKENIAPKHQNTLPLTPSSVNKKRKFDSISQEENGNNITALTAPNSDTFTQKLVEARNKKLLQTKQSQIVRSADFFEPLDADADSEHKSKKRRTDSDLGLNDLGEDIEEYSQLRLKERKLSRSDMKSCMKGRVFIKLGNLSSIHAVADERRQTMDAVIGSDWITIGIVVSVSETKKAKNNSQFCIVKLNDLVGHEASLFLFNQSYKKYSTLQSGTVIAVLNPSCLPAKDRKGFALRIGEEYKRIAILGTSEDIAFCTATTAKGKPCGSVYSKSAANRCDFHLQEHFNKERSARMEFNDLYSTPMPQSERERHRQSHMNLSKGTFEIGNTQIGIDVPEEKTAKSTPSKSKLSKDSQQVNEALNNTQAGSRYIKIMLGIPTDEEIQKAKDKEKRRGVTKTPAKPEENIESEDDDMVSLEESDDELVFLNEDENEDKIEPQVKSEAAIVKPEENNNAKEIVNLAYQCNECQHTSDKLCNKIGHHIVIVRAE